MQTLGPQPKSDEAPPLRPPAPNVFAARAERFETLAAHSSLDGWLRLLAALSRTQHDLLRNHPPVPVPDEAQLALADRHSMPPLAAGTWRRQPVWRDALPALIEAAAPRVPPGGKTALEFLRRAPAATIEALADRVLRAEFDGDHAVALPFVAAALQVYWTHLAMRIPLAPLDVSGVCPACGYLPVASVVRSGGDSDGRRFLHCALCNCEWHLVRIHCAACHGNAHLNYRQIEGGSGAVRAECCDDCGSYLKIFYIESDPQLDPVADDLASLSLDILLDEAGYARAGPNLLLAPGGT